MRGGQRSYIPGVGYIRIALVQSVELDQLNEEDARRDGFASADALRNELQRLYSAKLAAGHQAYCVTFRVLPADEQKK